MIRKRGSNWQVDLRVEDHRIRRSFKSMESAERYEKEILSRAKIGLNVTDLITSPLKNATIEGLAETVYEKHWKGTSNGLDAHRNVDLIMRIVGKKLPVTDITTVVIDDLVQNFKDHGNSNSTINNKMSALMVCLKFAHKRGWIDRLPFYERFKLAEGRLRYFSLEEEDMLYDTSNRLGQFEFSGFIRTLVETGLRTGELTRIVYKDIVYREGRWLLHVWHRGGIGKVVNKTKNGEMRVVPLDEKIVKIIQQKWKTLDDTNTELEKCTLSQEHRDTLLWDYSRSQIRTQWNNIRNVLGRMDDEEFVPHLCRHTCASRLVQAGVPIMHVQKWMGHKSIQITLKYAKLAPQQLYEALDTLNAKRKLVTA